VAGPTAGNDCRQEIPVDNSVYTQGVSFQTTTTV